MDVGGFDGFDVNQDGPEAGLSEEPMLCMAAGRGYDGVVELLLQHPYIEVNVRTPIKCGGLTALHLAVRKRTPPSACCRPAIPPRHPTAPPHRATPSPRRLTFYCTTAHSVHLSASRVTSL